MEEEQNQFTFDDTHARNLIKKAKRRSTLKTALIVVILTPLILAVLWYGFYHWRFSRADQSQREIVWHNQISAPNVHISHQSFELGVLGGTITSKTYKWLGTRPYIWEPLETTYNLLGRTSRLYGSFGSILLPEQLSAASPYGYNASTGDREMFFYYPASAYDSYEDSIGKLGQLKDTTLVELALSFDQDYSVEEINKLLPASVQPVWWWVDAYTDQYKQYLQETGMTIAANSLIIYGYHGEQFAPFDGGIDSFITSVEQLRQESKSFKWDADQIHEALAGDDDILDKSDVKIIGAVVTGTAGQLEALKWLPFIKASTFGVISDQTDIPD